ncbi:hypothetical protein SAMN05421821_101167 [Mucilaginibacter lappiensis]|uniref:Uncharacterized protein n=1 Tax=Mucilaginibacter lappiensis TaxID=354630 RepID=A0ABR6PDV3_9SPHI|nr:hypothetical protein [Mucilaginibacter lappiensis]MBB6107919.1 hypothetical protein [Mucilaginibacter lappiensis]SIP92570.1 hypothetical protein SAMN05421821_101167 [Mucilaginibacter lappiensis]
MPDKPIHKTTLRRFAQKKLLQYIIPNIFFNTIIAYASFAKLGYTHLFEGEQSLARLTLPMSLFLPFILTLDILKKTILAVEQGALDLAISDDLNKNRFAMQTAIINGVGTLLIVLAMMFTAQLSLPAHYKFNGPIMAYLDGLLAAAYSIIFTYFPIRKLKKYMSKQTKVPVSA